MKKLICLAMAMFMVLGCLAGCTTKAETIKIGILGPHTGDYAQYGVAVLNGAKMYIEEVNAAGGINGKQIEAVVYDQKGDSTEAITAFTRMVDEGITGLIGDVLTDNTIAVVGEANPINMPMITGSATAAAVTYNAETDTVYSNVFRTCFIDPFQGEKMAQYASEVLKAKTAAVIFETGNNYAVGLKDAFVAKAATLGITIVATEGYATGDVDFKSQLTNIKSANPDVILCPNYYEDDALIVTQARAAGLTSTFLGGDGWATVSQYASAADLEGSVYCSAYAEDATDALKAFKTAYVAKYAATPSMFAALGYDAAVVMIDAIKTVEAANAAAKEAGNDDAVLTIGSDAYKLAMIDAIKNTSAVGITSAYAFDNHNNPIKDAVIIKLVEGKEVFSQMF